MKRLSPAFALLFVCALAHAQTTASLGGRVTLDRMPVPGVTVTISSAALQGTRSTVTDENGAYRFLSLPPGDYAIEMELEGLRPVRTRTTLRLSQESRVDVPMQAVHTVSTYIVADAPSPIETREITTNLTLDFIERLPWQRNQLATSQFAPGVTSSAVSNGQLSIAGGPGYDNLVLVNGVVITENTRGQLRPMYVEDAIQETTVLLGAIPAEYGRFSGGVVNTITKSGGNSLSGSLRDSMTNPAWSAQTPAGEERPDHLNHVWEATLGGPAIRDHLWYFTAARWAKNDTARSTVPVPGAPPSPAISYSESNDQKRYELKLTAGTGRHTFVATGFRIDTNGSNSRFGNNIYDEASLTTRDDPESLLALNHQSVVSSDLLLEGQYSARRFSTRTGGKSTDLIGGTVLLDRANNNTRFHAPSLCAVCGEEERNNDDLLLKARAYFRNHDLVAGVDRFTESRFANNHQSGSDFLLFVSRATWRDGAIYPVITPTNQQGGGTFIRWSPILVPARENELRTDSAFVQDSWRLDPRWTIALGARWDRNHAVDSDGNVSADDSKISPRLGVQYDLRGDGSHRLNASFGEYASRIADNIASANQAAGNAASIDFAYRGPAINDRELTVPMDEVIRRVFEYFNSQQGGTANRAANNLRPNGTRTIPGYSAYFDGTLVSPSVREWTVGYGAQLARAGFARVDYIHRDWRDFYAGSVTASTRRAETPLGIPVDLALIRNSSNLERTYRGVLLQARWSPSRFDAGMHYTLSRLRGNDDSEAGSTGAIASVDPSIFYPEFFGYERATSAGPLAGEQTHRLRAWVSYDILPSLEVSLLHGYESGLPYSIAGPINLTRYAGAPANPGYASIPNGLYYFSDRGALRTEDVHSTDLALRYAFRLGAAELFAQGDVLNVFKNDAIFDAARISTTVATAATSTALLPFNPATDTPIECPRGASAATCTAMGAHYQLASNFGEPLNDLAYQRPRTWRISLGVRF